MMTVDDARELYYWVIEQACKDLSHTNKSIREDAERFIYEDDTGFEAMCKLNKICPIRIRRQMSIFLDRTDKVV